MSATARFGKLIMIPVVALSFGANAIADHAEETIKAWPMESQTAAMEMIGKYGQPAVVTDSALMWKDSGPWMKTIVTKEMAQHDFPVAHKDMLTNTLAMRVTDEQAAELALFDGSIIVSRTAGEVSARCDSEAHNILGLNLANDIVQGKIDSKMARTMFADIIAKEKAGEKHAYLQRLTFEPPKMAAGDPDMVMKGDASADHSKHTATVSKARDTTIDRSNPNTRNVSNVEGPKQTESPSKATGKTNNPK